jgi:FecR protein
MTRTSDRWLAALWLGLLAVSVTPGWAQTLAAATAKNANGMLVVVRHDGVETRLRGRGTVQVFDGDVLRTDGQGALIETDEGAQVVLNGNAIVKLVSRWEKGKGVTRILRVQRGEVWARNDDGQRAVELETPVGVLVARSAEVSVRLVSDSEAVATVVKGTADFSTPLSSCVLSAGTVSSASRGKTCTQPKVADVRSVTSWSHPLLGR